MNDGGVRCRDITVIRGKSTVLDHLNITIEPSTVCAIVGESGSGKTTLLRAIAGFDPLTSGQVTVAGVDMDGQPPQDRPVSLLFQEPRLFPALSVGENVSFAMRVRGAKSDERRQRARLLLDQVGLGDRIDDSIDGLSGGEQQRVSLARALCVRPKVLLLDEPFSAVDAPRRRALRDLVIEVGMADETTLVFVTHDIADARAIADTVAVLIDGTIAQHGPVHNVVAAPASSQVAELVGGRSILGTELQS